MRVVGRTGGTMADSDATTGVGSRGSVQLNPENMTTAERRAYRRALAAQASEAETDVNIALTAAQNEINAVKETAGSGATYDAAAEQAAKEAEFALAQAEEQVQNAKIGEQLAKSEADKAAAEKALEDAKAAAAKAAAEAAALAAAEKARLEAEIAAAKAAADAAKAAAAKAALDALKASQAAAANINTSGNVFLSTSPTAGGQSAADILAKQQAQQQAEAEKQAQMQRQSIIATLSDRFTKYNLTGLIPTIKRLAQDGASESTITFALQDTEDYKRRFRANEERLKKGLTVLSPAEYLNVEDSYRQILRSYGLSQFDNDDYVSQFLANDMSPAELSNRVTTAVQRVRNADPAISKTLKDYYGIGNADLVAYVLDPNQQFQKIERQVAAAEIGTAARVQGLEAGAAVAEQLAAQGISQAQAQRGYATIADILPTAEKLSDIYGGVEDQYRQAEAEQEVFNQLASAQRKRQKLTQREIAAFSGSSGLSRTSLTDQTGGQFQNPERTYRPRQCNRPIVGAIPFPRMNMRPTTNNEQKGGRLL